MKLVSSEAAGTRSELLPSDLLRFSTGVDELNGYFLNSLHWQAKAQWKFRELTSGQKPNQFASVLRSVGN